MPEARVLRRLAFEFKVNWQHHRGIVEQPEVRVSPLDESLIEIQTFVEYFGASQPGPWARIYEAIRWARDHFPASDLYYCEGLPSAVPDVPFTAADEAGLWRLWSKMYEPLPAEPDSCCGGPVELVGLNPDSASESCCPVCGSVYRLEGSGWRMDPEQEAALNDYIESRKKLAHEFPNLGEWIQRELDGSSRAPRP